MYSVRTESIKGLFTRREGYSCARRVTLSPGSTLPALLTCFVLCVILCNKIWKNLEVLYGKHVKFTKKGKISWSSRVDSSAHVLYWSKVSLRGGTKGRKGRTKIPMTLIWLNYPLKFSIKLHKTISKSSNANINGKRRDWNIQIYSKIY